MRFFAPTRVLLTAAGLLASLALGVQPLAAATITIVNMDGSGEGFNDITEVSPVGGNEGFTVGQQRLIAAQYAADLWGEALNSDVEIRVAARFELLPCGAGGAALAFAGPNCTHVDFTGAPVAGVLYPAPLANKLFGADLCPEASGCRCLTDDMTAILSSAIGTVCSLPVEWYYGLDKGADSGQGELDFVSVFMHELAHGLGFLTYVDPSTGKKLQGRDDAFMRYLEEHASGLTWDEMSFDVQRKNSALDNFGLHWVGANAIGAGTELLYGRDASTGHLFMYAPETVEPGSSVSHFDISMWPNDLLEPFYMGPNHDLNLAANLLVDIGWGPLRPPGVCGDGTVDLRREEQCDDGGESATCNADCTRASCGDGKINASAGETCDASGESATCDANCTDRICGDGTVNITAGEECDDSGESKTCDADCTEQRCGDGVRNASAGEGCDDGDLTNGDGCDSNCTVTACGNKIVTAGEECDDGNTIKGDGCDPNCTLTGCGNGIVTSGEKCDGDGAGHGGETATCDIDCTKASCGDGLANATAGEDCDARGESAECDADCTFPACGDGTVNATAGEGCDDAGESAACDADCTPARCGDGTINATAGETCDDKGQSATCDANCTVARCGDGTVNAKAGEICDDGDDDDGDGCDSNCTPTACGNGVIASPEECDDDNTSNGDGCDSACALEEGWRCSGTPTACDEICGDALVVGAEDCEDGNSVDGDGCDSNCTSTGCGNGIVTTGESCDDGDESETCDDDCTAASCGDGKTNAAAGENCDDAGESPTCDLDCTDVECGDGTQNAEAGEVCDDGNDDDGDGCDSNCTPTACGNDVVSAGETCDDGNTSAGDGCSESCLCEEMVCGDANYSCRLTASDALRILQSAVRLDVVCATWTCDVNDNGSVTAVDALAVLRAAIHIPVALECGQPDAVVFYLHDPSETLGSLQLEINYGTAAGDFAGAGSSVQCVNLIADARAAFNELPGRKLAMDFISTEGFVGPMSIARCEFTRTGHLQVKDFKVKLVEDRLLDGGPTEITTVVRGYPY